MLTSLLSLNKDKAVSHPTVDRRTDHMAVTIESYRLHAWQQIPIVELRT